MTYVILQYVLVAGFASLIADSFSMGIGDFLSSQAEVEHAKLEQEREMWEVENYLVGEQMEMVLIYMEKGMSQEDAMVFLFFTLFNLD